MQSSGSIAMTQPLWTTLLTGRKHARHLKSFSQALCSMLQHVCLSLGYDRSVGPAVLILVANHMLLRDTQQFKHCRVLLVLHAWCCLCCVHGDRYRCAHCLQRFFSGACRALGGLASSRGQCWPLPSPHFNHFFSWRCACARLSYDLGIARTLPSRCDVVLPHSSASLQPQCALQKLLAQS
jgi:hypothetical protein